MSPKARSTGAKSLVVVPFLQQARGRVQNCCRPAAGSGTAAAPIAGFRNCAGYGVYVNKTMELIKLHLLPESKTAAIIVGCTSRPSFDLLRS